MLLSTLANLPCPVIRIGSVLALIDSGATIPVWTRGQSVLKKLFPGTRPDKTVYAHVGGFGGPGRDSIVCIIPKIEIPTDMSKIVLQNIPVALAQLDVDISSEGSDIDSGCHLILPFNVFKNCQLICNYNKECYVDKMEIYSKTMNNVFRCNKRVTTVGNKSKLSGVFALYQDEDDFE